MLLSPSFLSLLFLLTSTLTSPMLPRDSSEALGNIQYFTSSWIGYTTSLKNISHTFNPSHHHKFNYSTIPLQDQYAVIAIESTYNMNFEYESYPIARIAAGPVLTATASHEVVHAIKEMMEALKPLFEAFEPFVGNLISTENVDLMLNEQDEIAALITAVEGVVVDEEKGSVSRQYEKHARVVEEARRDLIG